MFKLKSLKLKGNLRKICLLRKKKNEYRNHDCLKLCIIALLFNKLLKFYFK